MMNTTLKTLLIASLSLVLWARLPASEHELVIDPSTTFQTVEGFGTCIVSWIPAVIAFYDDDSFRRFYLDELGASVLRIDLWGRSALVEKENWEDISYHDFSFTGAGVRGGVFVRVAEELHAHANGELRVIASVWSPPDWMKVNGSKRNEHPDRRNFALNLDHPLEGGLWTGPAEGEEAVERFQYLGRNRLRHDRYLHFAKSLVEWTRFFQSRGIELYGIGPQNEPRFSHYFSSSVYTPEEFAELVRVIVWMFEHEGVAMPRLFGPETMTHDVAGNRLYLDALFARPESGDRMHALATHGYVDGYRTDENPDSAVAFRRLAEPYGKPIWMTEGGTGGHAWPAPIHQVGAAFMNSLVDGHAALIAPWQIAGQNATGHNLMTLDGPTKKTHTVMQFWRFIRPGMTRVDVGGEGGNLRAASFLDADSQNLVLILLNRSTAPVTADLSSTSATPYSVREAYLTDESHDCAQVDRGLGPLGPVELPAQSIITLLLEPDHG